jgi:cytochrome c oxidase cbb3-type subunit 3
MSSVCRLSALTALCAVLVACKRAPDAPPAAAGPGVSQTAVGPLPGHPAGQPADEKNPFEGDLEALKMGRRYFGSYNCAGCHGDHGGGGMGPSLRDDTWLYGSSDAKIANSIADGRAHGMPAWGLMLTPTQVWQITAYIKSLGTEKEPDPPR